MDTQVYKLDPQSPDPVPIDAAGKVIREAGLVAFPTETVYGLGANALDASAVAKIFLAKGRPQDNPLIVHIAEQDDLLRLSRKVPDLALELAARFWPGALTLVLPRSELVPEVVTAGLDSVAVRMPAHPLALALIKAAGVPIAAPSANLSGKPSPTLAQHVVADLNGRVEVVLDGGETDIGLESTVLDLTQSPPVLLRPGGITVEALEEVLGPVERHRAVAGTSVGIEVATAPGMKYRHYAPKARLILVEGEREVVWERMHKMVQGFLAEGKRVGAMTVDDRELQGVVVQKVVGRDLQDVAHNLFRCLREFDEHEVEVILAEGVSGTGLGLAIMNRLKKASFHVVRV